jgi:nitroreductase
MSETDRATAGPPDEVLSAALRAAAAAPSVHNTQPWLFRPTGTGVDVLVDRTRRLPVLDPDGREMLVSVGAAVFNLRVALNAAGYRTTVQRMPDSAEPDLAARVTAEAVSRHFRAARALASVIPGRHTNRRPFADRRVPFETMDELRAVAAAEHADLLEVGSELRDGILALTRTAENRMRSDPAYLRELASWTDPSSVGRSDGLPRHVLGPHPTDATLPLRDFAVGHGLPAATVEFEPDPTLLVLFTPGDTEAHWVRAGEALERIWLTATVRGLAVTPMSQLTEIASVRSLLADSTSGHVPQTVLRIGYPLSPALASPRRPLSELVVRTPPPAPR